MKTEDSLAHGFAAIAAATNTLTKATSYLVGVRPVPESIGDRILKAGNVGEILGGKGRVTLKLLPHEVKTAILSSGALNDPLVPSGTPTLDYGAQRTMFLQDLLASFPTVNGRIEIPTSSSKTNGAGPTVSGSPEQRENVTIPVSTYSFANSDEVVETIAHTAQASKNIWEDSGFVNAFVNGEMLYGLAEAIEGQLLNGSGGTGELNGLLANATAWANESPEITNEVDIIRSAIKQVRLANFGPNGIVLNEQDWFTIETRKRASSDDAYVAGDPRLGGEPTLWGLPVHVSNAIASGTFMVADFSRAAIIFDRQEPMIEVSRHNANSFTTGMLTFRASARLALVNVNPLAMVVGSL